MNRAGFAICGVVLCALATLLWAEPARLVYPKAPVGDVVEDYHGTAVADPYRWLEEPEATNTKEFVDAQNRLARAYLDGPVRQQIHGRLMKLWDYPRYSAPSRRGESWSFTRNTGMQSQSVLYIAPAPDGPPRVLIDPNTLSEDGTVSLSGTEFTEDGTLLAYGVSVAGSDQKEIRILAVADGKPSPEVLKWCKFSGIAWKHDNSGFFYNRFPFPKEGARQEAFNNKLYWHALGTGQDQDKLVLERPDEPEMSFGPNITDDGKYLVLHPSRGSAPTNRLYIRETASEGPFVKVIDSEIARFRVAGNDGPIFYCYTNLNAPRGRVIAIDLNSPAPDNFKELIAQAADAINWVRMVNDQFIVNYMHDAAHVLKVFNRDGSFVKEIELRTVGTVDVTGRRADKEMFITFSSMNYPSTIYRYDFATGAMTVFRKSEVQFDPEKYETNRIFATSKDGTRVPIFVAHRKGLKLDGTNPTILNGYGGFNVGLGPSFQVQRAAWLEQGGVYAVAILRGGDEYGEEWHKAGMLGNKQNVFDDFIAAGEHLCKAGYTNPRRLAIQGGSNGGLLVAACMLQRPDLYGAVLCHVPVTDMLRYHRFTVGRMWVPEYGNAEKSADHFKFMYAYSPLHNVKPGTSFPPILVTTADGDDRVVPSHARKFVATLQANASGANPILLSTQTRAGHGGGKPTYKQINESADVYAFLAKVFGMEWKDFGEGMGAK